MRERIGAKAPSDAKSANGPSEKPKHYQKPGSAFYPVNRGGLTRQLDLKKAPHEGRDAYREMMEFDPLVRWAADAQGNLFELNERWTDLTGQPTDQTLADGWRKFFHPGDGRRMLRAFSAALRQQSPIDIRCRLKSANGEWRYARMRARPRIGADGELVCWHGSIDDVHEQICAETELRDRSAQLDTVFSQAMVGILHRDLNARVLMANDRYCEIVGRSARELDGLPMAAFTHPDDRVWNLSLYERQAARGEPFQIEKRYLRPDGSAVWCAVHVSFVRDEDGRLHSTITVAQDITARRNAEHELRESKDLLNTVVDSVSDLIFVKDREGRLVLVNRAMREGCGELSEDARSERPALERFHGYRSADAQVIGSGKAVTRNETIVFQGEERSFETIKVPWRRGKEIVGIIGVSRDITDRMVREAALRESETHHRYSVQLNPQIPWTATSDGAVEELGPRWADFTGIEPEDGRGEGWIKAVHAEDAENLLARWQHSVATRTPLDVEYRLSDGDDSYRWVRARGAPRIDSTGKVVRWYGTLEDISDRRFAQAALQESEERFRLAARAARLGIWDHDLLRRRSKWSDEFRNIFGFAADVRPKATRVYERIHPDDQACVSALMDAISGPSDGQRFETTFRFFRADDDQERWLHAHCWRVRAGGQVNRVLIAVQDITAERTAEERIRWAASHDPLTRLPNRFAFQEELDRAISSARAAMVGLLLIDVDHLKQTNDWLGHDAGDALLCTLGTRLKTLGGDEAFAARLGGDEFALLFPNLGSKEEMTRIAARITSVLAEPFVHQERLLDCRGSLGGSIFPNDGANGAELLKAADMALYAAKGAGRGGLKMFRPAMRASLQQRASMVEQARAAVAAGEIIPFYQPKVKLDTGEIAGFEALLRWDQPGAGIRLPSAISAAFDNFDLAVALSDDIFAQVLRHMRQWLDDGVNFGTIAINASAAEFMHDNLAERVLEHLCRSGVPESHLELEVTETVFMGSGADYVDRALKTLSAAGVRIALDDFGTGYASLSHLQQYPVDVIKIDRSFVRNLGNGAGDAAIVNAVINLGNGLGMDVVAEGIETGAQARYLKEHGCLLGQGFLFGAAAPHASIAGMISNWRGRPDG